MTDLGTLGGNFSAAEAINASGRVVGFSYTADGTQHAFWYDGTAMRDLNALIPTNSGWVLTDAQSINDAGQVAGIGTFNGQTCAFLLTPLGTASGAPAALRGAADSPSPTAFVPAGAGVTPTGLAPALLVPAALGYPGGPAGGLPSGGGNGIVETNTAGTPGAGPADVSAFLLAIDPGPAAPSSGGAFLPTGGIPASGGGNAGMPPDPGRAALDALLGSWGRLAAMRKDAYSLGASTLPDRGATDSPFADPLAALDRFSADGGGGGKP
jgi:probable HAF family extracellular repeat protein